MRSSIVAAVVPALMAAAIVAPSAQASPRHARQPSPVALRTRMLTFVNRTRARQHLRPFEINTRLSDEALHHSKRMARDGALSHTPGLADLIRNEGGTVFGENLGKGRGLRGIRDAWLRGADTRRILLDPRFVHVGLGVVHIDGYFWVTFQAFD